MTPAYTQLADRIRAQILSGELSPGHRLPTETELSTVYAVGRNTAREALRSLAAEGLVTMRRGVSGGAFVTVPSHEQLSATLHTSFAALAGSQRITVATLLEVRELLEVPGAELAALRRTDEQLKAIEEAVDERLPDRGTGPDDSDRFHLRVVSAGHNPLLTVLSEPVFRILRERFLPDKASEGARLRAERDHREIAAYIRAKDQGGAREATRAHLRYLRGWYEGTPEHEDDEPLDTKNSEF